jgi:catechol 2,3-dioxygenase-like lactoylglutathione lyase family enzyme
MLNHISIGVRDIKASRRFYDAALKPLGYTCLSESDGSLGYGAKSAEFWLYKSTHPVAANEKSGLHFCFTAPTKKSVDGFHAGALEKGGKDNGKPGLREDYGEGYYAAFVVDPDGYRLEAYFESK